MNTTQFTFWKDEAFFIGFLNNYPDYKTQAFSKQELVENLKDLLIDLESDRAIHSPRRRIRVRVNETP
jgi:hypothetical protein